MTDPVPLTLSQVAELERLHRHGCIWTPVEREALLAAARELLELKSALEFLDRGDGNRGTHGVDSRAPALLELAKNLGWPGAEQ